MPRYYVTLAAEIEAESQDEALNKSDELCTYLTVGVGHDWDERGIKRLTYDDRGDGPIIEEMED